MSEAERPTTAGRPLASPVSPSSPAAALEAVLAGVKSVVRGYGTVELVTQGIDVTFQNGVVATCRQCRISWRVHTRHFKTLGWWTCPRGCASQMQAGS